MGVSSTWHSVLYQRAMSRSTLTVMSRNIFMSEPRKLPAVYTVSWYHDCECMRRWVLDVEWSWKWPCENPLTHILAWTTAVGC